MTDNNSNDAYEKFLQNVRPGAPMSEDDWLFHFDHQNHHGQSGPEVGTRAPDFALPDQSGAVQSRAELTGERGLLVVFARSADW